MYMYKVNAAPIDSEAIKHLPLPPETLVLSGPEEFDVAIDALTESGLDMDFAYELATQKLSHTTVPNTADAGQLDHHKGAPGEAQFTRGLISDALKDFLHKDDLDSASRLSAEALKLELHKRSARYN